MDLGLTWGFALSWRFQFPNAGQLRRSAGTGRLAICQALADPTASPTDDERRADRHEPLLSSVRRVGPQRREQLLHRRPAVVCVRAQAAQQDLADPAGHLRIRRRRADVALHDVGREAVIVLPAKGRSP